MGEPEHPGDFVRIDEVLGVHARCHGSSVYAR